MKVHYLTLEWALEGLDQGRITKDEFDIAVYCACKADWNTMKVPSYSAAQVCRFYGLDATDANLKRFRRALNSLEKATKDAIRDNYRKGDERPYAVFLPRENPWIDRVSLCNPLSLLSVPADVPADEAATVVNDEGYKESVENVSLPMSQQNRKSMSANTQGNQKNLEKDPLNPPPGDFSLRSAPPSREEDAAAGQNRHRKTLDSEQCEMLHQAALLYCDFSTKLYNGKFSPNVAHVQALLRYYEPKELIYAQASRFPLWEAPPKKTMAHFFAKAAKDAIDAARLRGNSKSRPEEWRNYQSYLTPLEPEWKAVLDAYAKVFPNERPNGQTEFEVSIDNHQH